MVESIGSGPARRRRGAQFRRKPARHCSAARPGCTCREAFPRRGMGVAFPSLQSFQEACATHHGRRSMGVLDDLGKFLKDKLGADDAKVKEFLDKLKDAAG